MKSHSCCCQAVVVCCIDFRFQKFINKWISKNLSGKAYDLISFAGSTKELKIVLKEIKISKELHHVKHVVLIHHEDCGAYGKQGTYDKHVKDLNKAQEKLLSIYPDLCIDLYYLHLNGQFEKISILNNKKSKTSTTKRPVRTTSCQHMNL